MKAEVNETKRKKSYYYVRTKFVNWLPNMTILAKYEIKYAWSDINSGGGMLGVDTPQIGQKWGGAPLEVHPSHLNFKKFFWSWSKTQLPKSDEKTPRGRGMGEGGWGSLYEKTSKVHPLPNFGTHVDVCAWLIKLSFPENIDS
jgi:hypothetical protein